MNRKIIIAFPMLILCLFSCKKKDHDSINGHVEISGKITDYVSNDPLPNSIVSLYAVNLRPTGLLNGTDTNTGSLLLTDTTDANGYYSFSYEAKGEYEFQIFADPQSDRYVNANSYPTGDENQNIKTSGTSVLNLSCDRSAYARVSLVNEAPTDTIYAIDIGCENDIQLYHFYKDSTIYVKLRGNPNKTNNVSYSGTNMVSRVLQMTAGPGDTINGPQYNY